MLESSRYIDLGVQTLHLGLFLLSKIKYVLFGIDKPAKVFELNMSVKIYHRSIVDVTGFI